MRVGCSSNKYLFYLQLAAPLLPASGQEYNDPQSQWVVSLGNIKLSEEMLKLLTTARQDKHRQKNICTHTYKCIQSPTQPLIYQKKYWHLQYILHYTSVCGPTMLAKYLQDPGIMVANAINNIFHSWISRVSQI